MISLISYTAALCIGITINLKTVVAPQEINNADKPMTSAVLPTRVQAIQVKSDISFSQDRDQKFLITADLIGLSPRLEVTQALEGIQNPRGSLYFQLGTPVVLGRPGYVFRDAFLSNENCEDQNDDSATCKIVLPAIQVYPSKGEVVDGLSPSVKSVRLSIYRWAVISKDGKLKNFTPQGREGLDDFLARIYRNDVGLPVSADELKSTKELKGYFLFDRILFDSSLDKASTSPEGTGSEVRYERRFALSQAGQRIPLLSPENRKTTNSNKYLIEREVSEEDQGSLRVNKDRFIIDQLEPGQFLQPQDLKFAKP